MKFFEFLSCPNSPNSSTKLIRTLLILILVSSLANCSPAELAQIQKCQSMSAQLKSKFIGVQLQNNLQKKRLGLKQLYTDMLVLNYNLQHMKETGNQIRQRQLQHRCKHLMSSLVKQIRQLIQKDFPNTNFDHVSQIQTYQQFAGAISFSSQEIEYILQAPQVFRTRQEFFWTQFAYMSQIMQNIANKISTLSGQQKSPYEQLYKAAEKLIHDMYPKLAQVEQIKLNALTNRLENAKQQITAAIATWKQTARLPFSGTRRRILLNISLLLANMLGDAITGKKMIAKNSQTQQQQKKKWQDMIDAIEAETQRLASAIRQTAHRQYFDLRQQHFPADVLKNIHQLLGLCNYYRDEWRGFLKDKEDQISYYRLQGVLTHVKEPSCFSFIEIMEKQLKTVQQQLLKHQEDIESGEDHQICRKGKQAIRDIRIILAELQKIKQDFDQARDFVVRKLEQIAQGTNQQHGTRGQSDVSSASGHP